MSACNTKDRLDELEARQAFQDDLIGKLNEVIARQDRELARLTLQLQALTEKLNDLAQAAPGATAEYEVPPHY
jgi:SlyX protein